MWIQPEWKAVGKHNPETKMGSNVSFAQISLSLFEKQSGISLIQENSKKFWTDRFEEFKYFLKPNYYLFILQERGGRIFLNRREPYNKCSFWCGLSTELSVKYYLFNRKISKSVNRVFFKTIRGTREWTRRAGEGGQVLKLFFRNFKMCIILCMIECDVSPERPCRNLSFYETLFTSPTNSLTMGA